MLHELVQALEYSLGYIERSVADLSSAELVAQPPGVPNHAMWTLGHVIRSCELVAGELGARPWLPDGWRETFGYGSRPSSDASRYPQKEKMIALLSESKRRLRETLLEQDESVLQQPLAGHLKQSLSEKEFPTLGQVLLQVVVAHTGYHAGQLTVWRRAIGKEAVAMFV
jgi:DinB superfamily